MAVERRTIQEIEDSSKRLGRHVAHDERSWNFPANVADQIVSTVHKTNRLPLDQGNLGSCTGNAMVGLLMSEPFFKPNRILIEDDAVSIYSAATHLDRERGIYPPTDTGSTGLAVAHVAKKRGFCSEYRHAFGMQHALKALVLAPVIIGINWYDSFDSPQAGNIISITPNAGVRGGHEVLVFGVDAERMLIHVMNSWGVGYGDHGVVHMPWESFDRLLHEQGDVTTVVA